MLIEGKPDGKEVTVNMQEVSYGRIMQKINLTGNLTYTQSPHVSTCSRLMQDMWLVLTDPSSPMICTKGGGGGGEGLYTGYKTCRSLGSVCIPRRGLRILCQWNLDSGFVELNSGYPSPGNSDFESNNNPYRLTWGDALSRDRFRLIEKSLQ